MLLNKGQSYLYENGLGPLWKAFADNINKGINGFIITKQPLIFLEKYKFGKTPICQFHDGINDAGIDPTNIKGLQELINHLVELGNSYLLIYEGIEVLFHHNEPKEIFNYIDNVQTKIKNSNIIAIFATEHLDDYISTKLKHTLIDLNFQDNVNKKISMRFNNTIFIGIGDVQIGKSPDILVTPLGSCVGVSLYDSVNKIGGMAHIMLPKSNGEKDPKYADYGVPYLIERMKKEGSKINQMRCDIAGGCNTFKHDYAEESIGQKNLKAVKNILTKYQIRINSEFTKQDSGIRISLNTSNGIVKCEKLTKP